MLSQIQTASEADIPDLSRVTFFDGQRLTADDLNQAATVQRELRWLHNRSLHSWGIGLGFGVNGKQGDRQISIQPGYAIDCRGREILLTETLTKPIPARADDGNGNPVIYFLVAAYPDDADLVALERRAGECGSDGVVRLREQAAIYWKAQGEQAVEAGIEIVLAQATVQNCQLGKALSLDQRRNARPSQQPYMAAGETVHGNTDWTVWKMTEDNEDRVIGVQTVVDTSAARFGTTPNYQAQLRGDRLIVVTVNNQTQFIFMEGIAFVTEAGRNSFKFNVFLPRGLFTSLGIQINPNEVLDSDDLKKRVTEIWTVAWFGVEG